MLKVLEDVDVAAVFNPWAAASALPFPVEGEGEELGDDADPSEESARVMMGFLAWYYDPAQTVRRDAIEARINRSAPPAVLHPSLRISSILR